MKTALVTGASGGIGSAVCYNLIKNGYFTVCHYCSGEDRIERFKQRLEREGLSDYACFYKADFSDYANVKSLYDFAISSFNHIDVLINNAGVDLIKQVNDTTESDFDAVSNVNFKASYLLSSLISEKMIERKGGNIVFISSVWGIAGASMESLYSANKSALIGLTRSLAKELAYSGIRVNCICPGVIDTKMNACFTSEEIKEILSEIPLQRLGRPEEVADLCEFLCSDKASYITGQIITIDGGYIL